ncbi:hypothetical protein ACFYVV_27495 [Streptomyces tendae]|uniref:hypothetical protein n=1 Tax=Streptomyces tendae TaxID=1932 RepID=UPI0036CF5FCD
MGGHVADVRRLHVGVTSRTVCRWNASLPGAAWSRLKSTPICGWSGVGVDDPGVA